MLTSAVYAAAFFLLADHLSDAVNVCLNQLKDLQLAIAITRVYEGDSGPVLRKLLENEVLAIAAQEGNRWLASWAFWMLRRRDMAVRALIVRSFLPAGQHTHTDKVADSSLHPPRDTRVPRPQGEAFSHGRPGPRRPLCTAATKDAPDAPRRVQGDTQGGVGIRGAQRPTI
jgi:hypothetical protein